jgi:hypothetical protein
LLPSKWVGRRAAREGQFVRTNRILVVLMLALLIAVASTAALARPQENGVKRFDIGVIGDFPYAPGQQIEAQNLLDELNGEKLAFVTHDGDIKSGSTAAPTTCTHRSTRASRVPRTPSSTPRRQRVDRLPPPAESLA